MIDTQLQEGWERAVLRIIRSLRFGSVEIVVHDGRVVQIETREKLRFAPPRLPKTDEDERRTIQQ